MTVIKDYHGKARQLAGVCEYLNQRTCTARLFVQSSCDTRHQPVASAQDEEASFRPQGFAAGAGRRDDSGDGPRVLPGKPISHLGRGAAGCRMNRTASARKCRQAWKLFRKQKAFWKPARGLRHNSRRCRSLGKFDHTVRAFDPECPTVSRSFAAHPDCLDLDQGEQIG